MSLVTPQRPPLTSNILLTSSLARPISTCPDLAIHLAGDVQAREVYFSREIQKVHGFDEQGVMLLAQLLHNRIPLLLLSKPCNRTTCQTPIATTSAVTHTVPTANQVPR